MSVRRVGPGSAGELFKELAAWDLFPKKGTADFYHCPWEEILEFVDALQMASPYAWGRATGPFEFTCSSSFWGAWHVGEEPEQPDLQPLHLARFAALYADCVLIPDPFSVIGDGDSLGTRIRLLSRLVSLRKLQPVIEAGLVRLAPSMFPVCNGHMREFETRRDMHEDDLEAAGNELVPAILAALRVRTSCAGQSPSVEVDGPDELLGGQPMTIRFLPEGPVGRAILSNESLPLEFLPDLVQTAFIRPIIDDLRGQGMYSWLLGTSYLTNRSLDYEFLRRVDVTSGRHGLGRVAIAMEHALPVVDGAPLQALLELRQAEPEAFRTYRSAFAETLRQHEGEPHEMRAIFDRVVRPELDRLDLEVKKIKKLVSAKVREKLIFGSGTLTIGLALGAVLPDVGSIIASLGGLKYGVEILEELNKTQKEPIEAMDNPYYFLWRAQVRAR